MEERRSNAEAVENALEAPLGEGMVRWMGEGEIKAGTGQFERRSYHSSFSQLGCCRLGHLLPSPKGVLVSNSSFRECTESLQVYYSMAKYTSTCAWSVLTEQTAERSVKRIVTKSWCPQLFIHASDCNQALNGL